MDPRHAGGITSLNWLSVQREELEEVTGEKVSHLINSRAGLLQSHHMYV